VALLLAGGALVPGAAQAQVKLSSPDAAITTRIVGAFARDPFLRGMDIQVETQSGVVSLTGFVRSLDDIVKAGELARAVSGVSAVRNSLRVADRPSRA
jgi:hyperosmotically inducible protein